MTLDNNALAYAVEKTSTPVNKAIAVCNLLFDQECTIPFIARYRKEATGGMDEVQIRDIKNFYEEYLEIEKRRSYVLETIEKMKLLTPELKKKILDAKTLNQLEDLYAPYKSKKKTKAMIATEKGLLPLAEMILTGDKDITTITSEIIDNFVTASAGKVKDLNEALNGACDILVEKFSHNTETKEYLREQFWNAGIVTSEARKDANEVKDASKFKDFFEFKEPVSKIKDPKNTHRYLALRRGMNLKVLKVSIDIDESIALTAIEADNFSQGDKLGNYDLLKKLAKKAYDTSIAPSLDLELKSELKTVADNAAINVFGVNLKNLLLQPYLGSKAVLGIDPGIRTGCKVVVIDHTGKYIGDHVIYPFAPKFDTKGAKQLLEKMIEAFHIEYIAIGNGTNGRETLAFVQENISAVKSGSVKATLVNEAGASIYSASDVAREEFPDKDVTVRGSISIARRFQDPLAELVKIDPKSIGVGQYQHDVNQSKLKKSLTAVVEDCVNYVGIDLNTASAPLLSYISGVGPSVAKNIVSFREKNGGFKSRTQLLEVPRFSQKIFEQSAGFMRIYNGENPLDATFIHPEQYPLIQTWAKEHKINLEQLVSDREQVQRLAKDGQLKEQVGLMTFDDIIKSLSAPKQDPRSEFRPVEFRKDVSSLEDLKAGQWYTGVVNNITNFGAFVDIGVKESGLLHISQMADKFVENPMDVLKVGQEIKVKVTEVDLERKRISLSAVSDAKVEYASPAPSSSSKKKVQSPQASMKNNAFAGLAGLKLKK